MNRPLNQPAPAYVSCTVRPQADLFMATLIEVDGAKTRAAVHCAVWYDPGEFQACLGDVMAVHTCDTCMLSEAPVTDGLVCPSTSALAIDCNSTLHVHCRI